MASPSPRRGLQSQPSSESRIFTKKDPNLSRCQEAIHSIYLCDACCFKQKPKRGTLQLWAGVRVPRQVCAVALDLVGSMVITLDILWVPDTLISLVGTIASILVYDTYFAHLGMNLSWTAVSFMMVWPIQNAIRDAFKRRERALDAMADFRGTLVNVYIANIQWNWGGADGWDGRHEDDIAKEHGGRGLKKKEHRGYPLSRDHPKRLRGLIERILDGMEGLFLVPRSGRARMETVCGQPEKLTIQYGEIEGRSQIILLLSRLHRSVEDLKAAGLPPNEDIGGAFYTRRPPGQSDFPVHLVPQQGLREVVELQGVPNEQRPSICHPRGHSAATVDLWSVLRVHCRDA
eukprot:TRINITY_DN42865_c0_g1_i1.p1 TRINITY_DN42865_c0_g1~~TRINITY_DN42865_c0_g1_i1.p1  ORF type:complete len:346 (+),score=36.56 TRINITY_DN42865_c0_g1_i1:77-1114(+)